MADYITGPFSGFHGDADLQTLMLTEVDKHIAADQVVQGTYGDGKGENFTGCFIGCTVHALKPDAQNFNSVQGVWDAYGFPAPLTKLCEEIFEGLPIGEHEAFFSAVPNAINLGGDLSLAHWKFLDWMLKDTFEKYATEDIRAGCAGALAVIEDLANGIPVTEERARAAYAAYAAARAAYAARAAARAAYAAYTTARAAARAAYAAYTTARAAYAARAADAADAARWREFAAKLVELIRDAA